MPRHSEHNLHDRPDRHSEMILTSHWSRLSLICGPEPITPLEGLLLSRPAVPEARANER